MKKDEYTQSQLSNARPEFLTVEELCEMLRVKRRTIYEMISQERIPYRKVGRRVVFLLSEILEWTSRAHSRPK
jgi:excisionase family DNA binding protein